MKEWTSDLETHVERWSKRLAKSGRGWWPQYVYHVTDVSNAIEILNTGVLHSRAECEHRGLMCHDNANPGVIASTDPDHLRFVRIYFRPQTPTQYINEGIKLTRRDDGHCPVPIFFFFRFVDLLARDDAHFSRGTMAGGGRTYSQRRDYFGDIPFDDVYSTGGWGKHSTLRQADIRKARHAEVLIPDSLRLGPELRAIVCRSPAERITLLDGLSEEASARWSRRVRTGSGPLYFRHRPHIKAVAALKPDEFSVELFKPSQRGFPFKLEFHPDDGDPVQRLETEFPADAQGSRYRLPRAYDSGVLECRIDGFLAFRGRLQLADVPL